MDWPELDQGVFAISVAAELSGLHPQTLRIYEREGLVGPGRSAGGTRLYSGGDVTRLREIAALIEGGLKSPVSNGYWSSKRRSDVCRPKWNASVLRLKSQPPTGQLAGAGAINDKSTCPDPTTSGPFATPDGRGANPGA